MLPHIVENLGKNAISNIVVNIQVTCLSLWKFEELTSTVYLRMEAQEKPLTEDIK